MFGLGTMEEQEQDGNRKTISLYYNPDVEIHATINFLQMWTYMLKEDRKKMKQRVHCLIERMRAGERALF